MSFKEIFESPVGAIGRTGVKDAEAHVTDELRAEFKKIVKKLGGKTVAGQLLRGPMIKGDITEGDRTPSVYIDLKKASKIKSFDSDLSLDVLIDNEEGYYDWDLSANTDGKTYTVIGSEKDLKNFLEYSGLKQYIKNIDSED